MEFTQRDIDAANSYVFWNMKGWIRITKGELQPTDQYLNLAKYEQGEIVFDSIEEDDFGMAIEDDSMYVIRRYWDERRRLLKTKGESL